MCLGIRALCTGLSVCLDVRMWKYWAPVCLCIRVSRYRAVKMSGYWGVRVFRFQVAEALKYYNIGELGAKVVG